MPIDMSRPEEAATPNRLKFVPAPQPTGKSMWNGFKALPVWYRPMRRALIKLFWRMRGLEYVLPALERELSSTVRVPIWRKPGLWRAGFLSESAVLYGFPGNDSRHYLSDIDRSVAVRRINRDYGVLLDDKLTFERMMAAIAAPRPVLFGVLEKGGCIATPHRNGSAAAPVEIFDLLDLHGSLVVKPARGGGGRGVSIVAGGSDGPLTVNGIEVGRDAVRALAEGDGEMLVYEHVDQHGILSTLFPKTLNTVRILTMTDTDGRPFMARAVLRIGTEASRPTDNWIRGGLCAPVDVLTGAVGSAVQFPAHSDRLTWFDRHPDNDAAIAGTALPCWQSVIRTVLDVAAQMPELPYVGWDIALTSDGAKILEGNSYSGVNLFQVHAPLLADPDIRAFFARNGVQPRKPRSAWNDPPLPPSHLGGRGQTSRVDLTR